MTPEQHLRIKLTLGYILLIVIFSLSIIYILKEVDSLNVPKDEILTENRKVIELSTIVSELYATENTGRLALLSYNKSDVRNYRLQSDSLISSIQLFKQNNIKDDVLHQKLDTIVELIHQKTNTFNQVLEVQSKYAQSNIYDNAKSDLQVIQSSIKGNTIEIDTVADKLSFWERLKTKRDIQQEKRLKQENEKIVAEQKKYLDSLNKATEVVLSKAQQTENKLLKEYYAKEEQLIKRNQILTVELREILLEVEKIILQNSSTKYENSKSMIDQVSNNIAKVGIIISLVALVFGFIILIDLNKSVRNKQKLEKLNSEMENLIKQKSFFMATISHDMVSPINSLIGFSSLLQNTLKISKQKEYLNNIVQSTKYIKKMVDDLSLFSNLEYNKIKIKKDKFNFNELINFIENNFRSTANSKQIDLVFNIDPELNNYFYSDSFRIQQILTNIVSNAIKFTHQGSVTLNAKLKNKVLKVEVIDTGIGMDLKDKNELFAAFVQVHDVNESNYGGSGLGLNISKRLIDLLGGEITFDSTLNKGTSFYITLPLVKYSDIKKVEKVDDYVYDNAKKLQNKKILVVDDDQLQLKLIKEIFGGKVKKLVTLENGRDAKEVLKTEQFNLIITDIQMPLYSGVKVIEDIRSLENYKETPVIALTGKIDVDENEYKQLGFNIYLKKPLNIDTLYNTIYKVLRLKKKDHMDINFQPTVHVVTEHFDLTDLLNLLEHDLDAVNDVLTSFFNIAKVDLLRLKEAHQNEDIDAIKNIAHKMLPMFRQLKITRIIDRLEALERNTENLSPTDMEHILQQIEKDFPLLIEEIKEYLEKINNQQ